MLRKTPLIEGETYHIFNRGAHKHAIFTSDDDYRRFQLNLYLANHSKPIIVRNILESKKYKEQFFVYPVDRSLVEVLAYSLMPNHFHLVLQQKTSDGITKFMKKVCGGYSMYFNLKHEHSGTLFQGPFKSNHVASDPYFKWIFTYVHLNPISIVEPAWDEKKIERPQRAQRFLATYLFSSYYDYYAQERPERNILSFEEGKISMEEKQDIESLLASYGRGRALYNLQNTKNSSL